MGAERQCSEVSVETYGVCKCVGWGVGVGWVWGGCNKHDTARTETRGTCVDRKIGRVTLQLIAPSVRAWTLRRSRGTVAESILSKIVFLRPDRSRTGKVCHKEKKNNASCNQTERNDQVEFCGFRFRKNQV